MNKSIELFLPGGTKACWVAASRAVNRKFAEYVAEAVEAKIMQDINLVVQEAAQLAEEMLDLPVSFSRRRVAEGAEAMRHAAQAYAKAEDNAARLDAALWLGEAYLLLSSGLPDTGSSETATGWATANQISKLLGGPMIWETRVKLAFSPLE